MTAEVAILNKSAIALAADSAVTIRQTNGEKIYNTVNKLFTLSKHHPVGIMIYGTASLVGVPWESIIKIYREQLGRKSFPHVGDYVDDFIRFLEKTAFIPKDDIEFFTKQRIQLPFEIIKNEIGQEVKKETDQGKQIPLSQIESIIKGVVLKHKTLIENFESLECFKIADHAEFRSKIDPIASAVRDQIFEKLPFTDEIIELLNEIATLIFSKDLFEGVLKDYSGMVIAGFGSDDIYPSIYEHYIHGIVAGKVISKVKNKYHTTSNSSAGIFPFAQKSTVMTFLDGIDQEYLSWIGNYLETMLEGYKAEIIGNLTELSEEKKAELNEKLGEFAEKNLTELMANFKKFRKSKNIDPIIDTVEVLPKDELAAMAETFVNLTSFKQRISSNAETVGGPIDVAVISKGDGFVWIKRKHYFKPELNAFFYQTYFKPELSAKESSSGENG